VRELTARNPERVKNLVFRNASSTQVADREFAASTVCSLVHYDYEYTRDTLIFLMVDQARREFSWDDACEVAHDEASLMMRDHMTPGQKPGDTEEDAPYGSFTAKKLLLVKYKLGFLLGEMYTNALDVLPRLAYRFAYEHEDLYWYSDALATSSIYTAVLDKPDRILIAEVERCYQLLGRGDRWEMLRNAMRAWPKDLKAFRRYCVYLLLP